MMKNWFPGNAGAACALSVLLLAGGCRRHRETQYAQNLQQLVANKKLPPEKVNTAQVPNLRWPNFSDYAPRCRLSMKTGLHRGVDVTMARQRQRREASSRRFNMPTQKGLTPEDYDASRWPARVERLSTKSADAISLFDVAMTVNVMRYVSNLHIGRVNPSHFSFDIPVREKKYDLAKFVADNAVTATDVRKLMAGVEPGLG